MNKREIEVDKYKSHLKEMPYKIYKKNKNKNSSEKKNNVLKRNNII